MEENIFDKVHEVDLEKTMKDSYIDYAMSVIASRALPDVRDGLKPVQRRVLYSMIELNNGPDKPHRKCARIVGDTMGKYHPHGDSSIYGALVNMAQEWSTRYPLVDGHGNFGSVDGDGAAAMRYTEARLSKISMEMLADINKDTVDFQPNFDETEREPAVLPSRYPNLLVNGTSGIAVGMATNIPPHNLREVISAVVKIIDNIIEEDRETTIEELVEIVKGPDFPTGATILGRRGIEEAYRTGRGKIRVRAVTNIETLPNGKSRIIVTELPYLVNKARLISKIAELVRDKKIDGIVAVSYTHLDVYKRQIHDVAVKPYCSRYKIYIVPDAHLMNPQAQNALLKTIEEPPEYAVIMLLTSNIDGLLPTIRSRCVRLDLKVVDDGLIKEYLMEHLHIPDYQAEIDVSFAHGSIGRAKAAATSQEFVDMTQNAMKLLKYSGTMEVYELTDAIRELASDKQNIGDYLDIFQFWFRDILMFKATREIDNLVFKQEINFIKEQARERSYENIEKILEAIEKTKVRLRANVNLELALELLFLTIREK